MSYVALKKRISSKNRAFCLALSSYKTLFLTFCAFLLFSQNAGSVSDFFFFFLLRAIIAMMKVPILVAVGVSEAGARGLHASQATVPEMDRADQEHQGHQSALQQVGLCVGIARKKITVTGFVVPATAVWEGG